VQQVGVKIYLYLVARKLCNIKPITVFRIIYQWSIPRTTSWSCLILRYYCPVYVYTCTLLLIPGFIPWQQVSRNPTFILMPKTEGELHFFCLLKSPWYCALLSAVT